MKNTWKIINEIINKPSSNKSFHDKFTNNDGIIQDPTEIANEFNNYFVNIGPSLAAGIPITPTCSAKASLPSLSSSFAFRPVNEQELYEVVANLKLTGAGHDELKMKLLKQCLPSILKPLLYIFNRSLQTGVVPDKLKWAKVLPLYKADDPSTFSNYRPISILPCFSKVLEKIVYNRLLAYFKENKLLYDHQYGFRENHSTSMALVQLLDNITNALDNNDFTIGVFIDLSKAFDTVDHSILLHKLHDYGIHGKELQWFKSYLSDRKQFVTWNGVNSKYMDIQCGVPQGSILGPLLFLIYINDLHFVSEKAFFILFADDTNIFLSDKDEQRLLSSMNDILDKVDLWFKTNKLSLNVKKSSYMIFKRRNKCILHPRNPVFIANNALEHVSHAKFLGINIDDQLNWKRHISFVSNKIAKNIGVIRRIRHVLSSKILLNLYYTMIYPFISYGNIVWASTYETNLKVIFLLQKRFVRMVTNSNRFSHSAPLFLNLEILNIYDINKFQICLFVFKFLNNSLPNSFKHFFHINSQIHFYNTRSSNQLHTHYFRTRLAQSSIKYRGPVLWNNLSTILQSYSSLYCFKKYLKLFLLNESCIN